MQKSGAHGSWRILRLSSVGCYVVGILPQASWKRKSSVWDPHLEVNKTKKSREDNLSFQDIDANGRCRSVFDSRPKVGGEGFAPGATES